MQKKQQFKSQSCLRVDAAQQCPQKPNNENVYTVINLLNKLSNGHRNTLLPSIPGNNTQFNKIYNHAVVQQQSSWLIHKNLQDFNKRNSNLQRTEKKTRMASIDRKEVSYSTATLICIYFMCVPASPRPHRFITDVSVLRSPVT